MDVERATKWMSTSAALTAAVLMSVTLGCTSHESPSGEGPHGDLETDAEPQLLLLTSSKQRLAAGDIEAAIDDLIEASEIASTLVNGSEDFCMFGDSVIEIADQLFEANHHQQSVLAYAIAVRFAQDCPELDRKDLRQRLEHAQAAASLAQTLDRPR